MNINNSNPVDSQELDVDLKEIISIIYRYKWSIIFITLLFTMSTYIYLYFKPSIYRSTALVEVKSNLQTQAEAGDFLAASYAGIGNEKIDKEIEFLKTFYINNKVLNKIDLKTRFFIDSDYKKVEIYENIPIEIKNIAIFDQLIIGKMIKLTPSEGGYNLEIYESDFKKIKNKIFSYFPSNNNKKIMINPKRLYEYNRTIDTEYFEFTVNQLYTFKNPIYLILNGNNRQIFDKYKNNLIISQVSKDAPLIRVEYEDTIIKRADEYTNSLIDIFVEQSIEDKSKKVGQLINFIDDQLPQIKKKLDTYETKLEVYQREHDALQPSFQGTKYINEISDIENQISEEKLKQELISNIIKMTKNNNDIHMFTTSLINLDDQPTLALISKLQEIQITEEELRAKYSYKHPSLRPIRKQLHHIKKSILKNIMNLNIRINERIKSLQALKSSYKHKLDTLPAKERKLIGLKRDYEVESKIYNLLLQKRTENQMLQVATQSDYRVIDYANNTRGIPVKPKRLLILILGILLGLMFGVLQAFIRNFYDDKVKSRFNLEELTGLPIYGVILQMKNKNIGLEIYKNTKAPFAESFRSLRTNLQFALQKDKSNVILITSSISGEGKSTTSANLSAILQIAGYKTIIINLDMRKPVLHKLFNVDNTIGMSTYLGGKNSMQEIICHTEYENLDVIPSGPIPPNPSELMMSEKLKELIDQLKMKYDYIIIDTPPLGLVSDTMNLMKYSDLNLVIFRENYSKKNYIKDLNNLVDRHQLKHIGLILNGSHLSSGSYGYGYGYGYGNIE